MNLSFARFCSLLLLLCFSAGCANIVPPEGGPRDLTPPRLLRVAPADSQLNVRPARIELRFDEYVVLANASAEVQISPLLPVPLTVTSVNRSVRVALPDSLLLPGTTYRISFGSAIQDLRENNVFADYIYTFSTGSYFDTLELRGQAIIAATGQPDSAARILLYDAARGDSAIIREKPLYVTTAGPDGRFLIGGLPARPFRVYALKDGNNNLMFDGNTERVGFLPEGPVTPSPDSVPGLLLRTFAEPADSAAAAPSGRPAMGAKPRLGSDAAAAFSYSVAVDTADLRRRSMDIHKPLAINFNRKPATLNAERVMLSFDSLGAEIETPIQLLPDSTDSLNALIVTNWRENALYTLRLLKNFAVDSAGGGAMPGRYSFRTRRDEDYGRLHIHLPARMGSGAYVLQVVRDGSDTLYQKPVSDTMVQLRLLPPGAYTLTVILDENRNGRWDGGLLLEGRQPELVFPYSQPIQLKAGWENMIDFEPAPTSGGKVLMGGAPPEKE